MREMLKKRLYVLSSVLLVSAITVPFMPLAADWKEHDSMWLSYVLAAVFWIGLIAGYVLFADIQKKCAQIRQKMKKDIHGNLWNTMPVATNVYGLAGNALCVLAILLYIICNIFAIGADIWISINIFLILTGIHMSVLCNSISFIYILKLKDRRVEKHEE